MPAVNPFSTVFLFRFDVEDPFRPCAEAGAFFLEPNHRIGDAASACSRDDRPATRMLSLCRGELAAGAGAGEGEGEGGGGGKAGDEIDVRDVAQRAATAAEAAGESGGGEARCNGRLELRFLETILCSR